MWLILIIILGLISGSFLTAFIDRFKDGRNFIIGRSECDNCHKSLTALDLIPLISWLLLRGKCRHCQQVIRPYYPLVELFTASLFTLFYLWWPFSFVGWDLGLFALWLIILIILLALMIYDWRWFILPNQLTYLGIILAFVVIGLRFLAGHDLHWLDLIISPLIGGGIFYIIFQISEKYIGGGDVKLGFLIGLLLSDWQLAILMIFLSSLLGVFISLPRIIIHIKQKRHLSAQIPFGPFLIISCWLCFWFGQSIIDWYLSLRPEMV
ncbi:MAG: prepilin peptidase [Candidatus Saccharibacteria bacterium]|nr:prepilin peptidase [Candidatus Saccharibacteria bacterium]